MTINANNPSLAGAIDQRWFEHDDNTIASSAYACAMSIERSTWQRRMLNMICTRYMTNREVAGSYIYSMAARPIALASRMKGAEWTPPTDNIIDTYADVYRSRIWKQRPFIMVAPIAGNFKMWLRSLQMSRFIDAVFHDTKFWNTHEQCGDDAMTVGDGFVKVHQSLTDKKKIAITRVLADEILVNEEEFSQSGGAHSMLQRCFSHVDELIAMFGTTPAKRDAIWRSPGVHTGFFRGELNAKDIKPYIEGWAKSGFNSHTNKEIKGKHIVCIGNVLLDVEDWEKDHFPFAKLTFKRIPNGYFGQSLAEVLLPYQAELNRYDAADWENQQRISWPRVFNPVGSQVTAAQFQGQSGGIINYVPVNGAKPEFVFPDATNVIAEQRRARIKRDAAMRARISDAAAKAEKPEGLNSGTAIMAWQSIEDGAHVDLGQRDEDFVTNVGELVLELAEEIKPTVLLPGRTVQEIKWDDVSMSKDSYHARAFPMSSLPQLPAARQQKIDNWYASGYISKTVKLRLEQVPDVDGFADLVNSALSDLHMVCDAIVESGEYSPPEPFEDLAQGIEIFNSRWLQERTRKTPEDRLNLLLQWIMQADEMIQAGAGPVGIQTPAGAPAAPPSQVMPAQAAPQPMVQ